MSGLRRRVTCTSICPIFKPSSSLRLHPVTLSAQELPYVSLEDLFAGRELQMSVLPLAARRSVPGVYAGGRKRDEVVMIGAHLDSWHSGTGATDNAAGSAVMIEVMRILKTLNLRLDRTVRLALWSGEEQGLLGSRAYVTEHFAAREDMKLKPEHARLSAYFNVDNGSGKIRGVYLQGNDAMRPIFRRG